MSEEEPDLKRRDSDRTQQDALRFLMRTVEVLRGVAWIAVTMVAIISIAGCVALGLALSNADANNAADVRALAKSGAALRRADAALAATVQNGQLLAVVQRSRVASFTRECEEAKIQNAVLSKFLLAIPETRQERAQQPPGSRKRLTDKLVGLIFPIHRDCAAYARSEALKR